MKNKYLLGGLITLVVAIILSLSIYFFLNHNESKTPKKQNESKQEQQTQDKPESKEEVKSEIPDWVKDYTILENPTMHKDEEVSSSVSMVATGDNLFHQSVINDGGQLEKKDYHHIYTNVKPIIESADLAVVNQETPIGGNDLGLSGYPLFNTPEEVGDTLVDTGFDVITQATNHAFDYGEKGVVGTLKFWEKYPEITLVGLNETSTSDRVKYVEKNDVKFAFMNYTFGTNGIEIPNKSWLTNVIDKDKIKADVLEAKKQSDITVVSMHWGVEYQFEPNSAQKDLAQFLADLGVDVVIGTHSHTLQPVEWIQGQDTGKNTLVYYSLGNFVSSQEIIEGMVGGLAYIQFEKYSNGTVGVSRAAIAPVVTDYKEGKKTFSISLIKEYTEQQAESHGVGQFVGKKNLADFVSIPKKVLGEWYND